MSTDNTMKALVLHAVGDLRYEDVPKPQPKAGEVLLKVRACGICSSDIERVFLSGTYHFPTIIGHEFAGEIVGLGEGVDESYLGKRAAVFPLLPCRKCSACEKKQYAQCANYNYFGSRCDGGMAEYLAVPTWNLVMFDDSVSFEEAALCEPAAVGVHATKLAGIKDGDCVTIIGTGTIGYLIGCFAKMRGAKKVILCGITDDRPPIVDEEGFELINLTKCDDIEAKIKELNGGKGADVAFECVGTNQALTDTLKAAGDFATIVLVGNPKRDVALEQKVYWKILRKQLTLKGTWNSTYNDEVNDWQDVLKYLGEKKVNLKPFVTKTYKMADKYEAFEHVKDLSRFSLKIMFTMD